MGVQLVFILLVFLKFVFTTPVTYAVKENFANHKSTILPDTDMCGLPQILSKASSFSPQTRIATYTKESDTKQGEFPWMAALEYNDYGGIKCGGFLITNRYVLTAAHCLNDTKKLNKVWLGVWKKSRVDTKDADKVKKIDIEKAIPHESYQNIKGGHDIALLKLQEEVQFTDYITPICLPKPSLAVPEVQTNLTVAGWGYTTESGPRSNLLLKVEIPVVNSNICQELFKVPVTDHQLCAGGIRGLDSCQGDSGGPLMHTFTNDDGKLQWYAQGIISYGIGCGRVGQPGVYTRVSEYIDWILSKLE